MAAVLLPLAQLRRLEHVSYLSLGSAAAVGGVVLLCLRQMAADVAAQNPALPVATQWATHADALEGFHALSTMIFACGACPALSGTRQCTVGRWHSFLCTMNGPSLLLARGPTSLEQTGSCGRQARCERADTTPLALYIYA
jgi:hypothetical protein